MSWLDVPMDPPDPPPDGWRYLLPAEEWRFWECGHAGATTTPQRSYSAPER